MMPSRQIVSVSHCLLTTQCYHLLLLLRLNMPSAPYVSALFAAGTELWQYPKWQERTKYAVPPFASDATPSLTRLDANQISAVKAFSARVHKITPHAKLLEAFNNKRDNDSEGRRAWETWTKDNFDKWKVVQDMEAVLFEEGRHPRQLIGQQGFVSAQIVCMWL
jgi:hypothetical protein